VKGNGHHQAAQRALDQALDIVLKSKGLGREDVGNIIRVAPIETPAGRAEGRRGGVQEPAGDGAASRSA